MNLSRNKKMIFAAGLFLVTLGISQCGGTTAATTSTTTTTTTSSSSSTTESFPSGLAITSPTATGDSSSNLVRALSQRNLSSYETETAEIDALLSATDLEDCEADLSNIMNQAVNADCYGPTLNYQFHPDGSGGAGQLPSGDLGLWDATEGETDEACAAAQVNARVGAVGDKTMAALKMLASMICTVNNTETLEIPAEGSSLSMATEMNAMLDAAGVTSVEVNTATLATASNDVETLDYTYSLNVTATIANPDNPSETLETDLQIDMTHRPLDEDNSTFEGLFSYYFNGSDSMGNCSRDFGILNTEDVTELGSVAYEQASSTSLKIDARYTQACGTGNTDPLVDGELDPSVAAVSTHESGTPSLDGWAANFSILMADFDPTTSEGNYVFSWQAGVGDGTARTFNLHLEDDDSDGNMNGTAFFGYGDEMADSDGSILGMYCNWAGPGGGVGNDTTKRRDLVQRQTMEENATSGLFEVVASNITYAPTLDCNADSSDLTGGFQFDTDGDGFTDVLTSTITNNLVDPEDVTSGVTASGFTLPEAPSGL